MLLSKDPRDLATAEACLNGVLRTGLVHEASGSTLILSPPSQICFCEVFETTTFHNALQCLSSPVHFSPVCCCSPQSHRKTRGGVVPRGRGLQSHGIPAEGLGVRGVFSDPGSQIISNDSRVEKGEKGQGEIAKLWYVPKMGNFRRVSGDF